VELLCATLEGAVADLVVMIVASIVDFGAKVGCGAVALGCGAVALGCGVPALGCGVAALGCGVAALGCGVLLALTVVLPVSTGAGDVVFVSL